MKFRSFFTSTFALGAFLLAFTHPPFALAGGDKNIIPPKTNQSSFGKKEDKKPSSGHVHSSLTASQRSRSYHGHMEEEAKNDSEETESQKPEKTPPLNLRSTFTYLNRAAEGDQNELRSFKLPPKKRSHNSNNNNNSNNSNNSNARLSDAERKHDEECRSKVFLMAEGTRELDLKRIQHLIKRLTELSQNGDFTDWFRKRNSTSVREAMRVWRNFPNLGLFLKNKNNKNLLELASYKEDGMGEHTLKIKENLIRVLLNLSESKEDSKLVKGLMHLFRFIDEEKNLAFKKEEILKAMRGDPKYKHSWFGHAYLKNCSFYQAVEQGHSELVLAYLYILNQVEATTEDIKALFNHKAKGQNLSAVEYVSQKLEDREDIENDASSYERIQRIFNHFLDPENPEKSIEKYEAASTNTNPEDVIHTNSHENLNNDNIIIGEEEPANLNEIGDEQGPSFRGWRSLPIHASWAVISEELQRIARNPEEINDEFAEWLSEIGKDLITRPPNRLPSYVEEDRQNALLVFLWRLNQRGETMLSILLPNAYRSGHEGVDRVHPIEGSDEALIEEMWGRLCGASAMLDYRSYELIAQMARRALRAIRQLVEAESDEARMNTLDDLDAQLNNEDGEGGLGGFWANILNWGYLLDNEGGPLFGLPDPSSMEDYHRQGDVLVNRFVMLALHTPTNKENDSKKAKWIAAAFKTVIKEGTEAGGHAIAQQALERVKRLLPPSWTRLNVEHGGMQEFEHAPVQGQNFSLANLVLDHIVEDMPPEQADHIKAALRAGAGIALNVAETIGVNALDMIVYTYCPNWGPAMRLILDMYRRITKTQAPSEEKIEELRAQQRQKKNQ